jgi:hypothetical protein
VIKECGGNATKRKEGNRKKIKKEHIRPKSEREKLQKKKREEGKIVHEKGETQI